MSVPWIAARLDILAEKWLRGGVRPPDAPSGVSASPRDSSARVYWRGLQGEDVQTYYRIDDGPEVLIETLVHGKYTIQGLTNGTTHAVELRVRTPHGESAWSAPVFVTPVPETVYASIVIRSRYDLFGFVAFHDMSQLPSEMWDAIDALDGSIRIYDEYDDEVPIDLVTWNRAARTGTLFYKTNLSVGATIHRVRVSSDAWPSPVSATGREFVWNAYLRVYIHDWFDRSGKGDIEKVSPSGLPAAGQPLVSSNTTPRYFSSDVAHVSQYTMGFYVTPTSTSAENYAASYGRSSEDTLFRAMHGHGGGSPKPFGVVTYAVKRITSPSVVGQVGTRFRHNAVIISNSTATTAYHDGVPVARAYDFQTTTRSSNGLRANITLGAGTDAGAYPLRGSMEWFYFTDKALSDGWIEMENKVWSDPATYAPVYLGPPPYEVEHLWWDGSEKEDAFLKGYWDGSDVRDTNLLGWWDGVVVRSLRATGVPPLPPPSEVYPVGPAQTIQGVTDAYSITLQTPPGLRPGDVILCAFTLYTIVPPPYTVTGPDWIHLGNADDSYIDYTGDGSRMKPIVMAYRVTSSTPSTHVLTLNAPTNSRVRMTCWRNVGTLDPSQSVYMPNVSGNYMTTQQPIPGTVPKGSRLAILSDTRWNLRYGDEFLVATVQHPALGRPHDYASNGNTIVNGALQVWPVLETASDLTVPLLTFFHGSQDNVSVAVVLPYDE